MIAQAGMDRQLLDQLIRLLCLGATSPELKSIDLHLSGGTVVTVTVANTAELRSILKKCGGSEVEEILGGNILSNFASLKPGAQYRVIKYDDMIQQSSGKNGIVMN